MVVPPPSKQELRALLKVRRATYVSALSLSERQGAAILLKEQALKHLGDATSAAVYWPIGSEIDTLPLLETLAVRGVRTALPHLTGRMDIPRFLQWSPGDALIPGVFDLRQPDVTADDVEPDVIFAPLLGFDTARHRIGYGAGCYDRLFARFPAARRIGIAWDIQRVKDVPTDPWDIPLHAIATEQDCY
jgi:5-formyltetrahydrofolate cyclo-ligase